MLFNDKGVSGKDKRFIKHKGIKTKRWQLFMIEFRFQLIFVQYYMYMRFINTWEWKVKQILGRLILKRLGWSVVCDWYWFIGLWSTFFIPKVKNVSATLILSAVNHDQNEPTLILFEIFHGGRILRNLAWKLTSSIANPEVSSKLTI